MKFSTKMLLAVMILPLSIVCTGQIKNPTTETAKIYGNCGMCKTSIEKAGNLKHEAIVDWNKDTKMATLTYDAEKTNLDVILKRIALMGYDSDEFLAPIDAYEKLPGCCQYERTNLTEAEMDNMAMNPLESTSDKAGFEEVEIVMPKKDIISKKTAEKVVTNPPKPQSKNQFSLLFDAYFVVKDELVKTNSETASSQAKYLATVINAVKMESLSNEEMTIWMKVMKPLASDATRIANTKDIAAQRSYFISLSENMYSLMKVVKAETPIYYQFCPMANDGKGANWLSKENVVKNPYYGSQMLSCGKTVETIK